MAARETEASGLGVRICVDEVWILIGNGKMKSRELSILNQDRWIDEETGTAKFGHRGKGSEVATKSVHS